MIRTATIEDIPALVEMGAKFHAMSPHRFMGEYDPQGIGNVLRFMIESPQGIVLTNGTGLIGGTLSPVYFAPSKLMCEENYLFAEGGGFALLEALEEHAKALGASFVLMSSLENEKSAAMERILRRVGYRALERRYIKEIA